MARPHEVWHGWMAGKLFRITREHSHRPEFKVGDVVKCVIPLDAAQTPAFRPE